MYVPIRDENQINFKFPWERNTARGFGMALAITACVILLMSVFKFKLDTPVSPDSRIIPIDLTMINFGDGDGTGMSKGNLSKEGEAHQGAQVKSQLEDASVAAKTKINKNATDQDYSQSQNLIATNELATAQKGVTDNNGSGSKNVGSANGSPNGTGLGSKGSGPGAGYGNGDIEWGGGGNRIVTRKVLPTYPQGANSNSQVRIRFIVASDGTVTEMRPMQKGGDPILERAAMNALKQWRFNPLKDNKDMYGIITFTFRLS
jgi:protein TonB